MRNLGWCLALGLGLLGLPLAADGQERGTITGRVVDATTQQPLANVQVFIRQGNRGTLTNQQGQFILAGIPLGTHQLEAARLGYNGATRTVTVAAGRTESVAFELQPSAVALDALVVTATGEQRARELANAVSTVDAREVMETAPVTNISELITGRAAGVNILQNSGTTGSNQRIRIRGSTSLSLSNDPIVFIDGLRAYSEQNALGIGVGGQEASALNLLNPEEIESVEIIKGPSAATLYGTDAANGVILVTTKRGAAGTARWNVWAESGRITEPNEYPLNYRGQTATGSRCLLFQAAAGSCTRTELLAYSPLEDPEFSPFGTGSRQQYGASVSGGSEVTTYFFSGEYEDEIGVFELPAFYRRPLEEAGAEIPESRRRPNSLDRVSLRANVGTRLAEGARADVNVGYISSDGFFPQNDNNSWGILPSGLLGNPFRSEESNFGYGFLTPAENFAIEVEQETERIVGSVNLNWEVLDWLTTRATVGLDNSARHDQRFIPVGEIRAGFSRFLNRGARSSLRLQALQYTVDGGATARFQLTPDLTSRSSVGVQYFRDFRQSTIATGEELPPGTRSAGAGALQFAGESTSENITLGTFVEQQVGWRDRLFVTGAVRADDNSAFGRDFDLIVYPKLGASYVAIDEATEPWFNLVNSLRLRAAWGQAGRSPGATDALLFFQPQTSSVAGQDLPGITFGTNVGLGNPNLKPERSQELEIGFDMDLLDGRAGLQATWYDKDTENLLVSRPLPPSLGVPNERFENLGRVENQGWEVALTATPVRLRNVSWDFSISGSHNENELKELGLEVDSILFGNQRFQEGFPLGGFFGRTVTFDDENGNGVIDLGEFDIATEETFIGSAFPETEISFQSAITLFDLFRVSGLLDFRDDFYQYNFTEEFRCRFGICRGLNDPDAPLNEQARALQTATAGARRSGAPYIEDASFWKLRELSFQLMVPDRFLRRVGASRASLVLSGRNLGTWTDYTGLDPELNQVAGANFSSREFLTQPPVRTWILRLNLGF
jgi:TonB-linked SusC/RagA family outer membrane protein